MPEKKEIIYRCPVCFSREVDVVLHKHGDTYYCVKCSFWGTKEKIRDMYVDMKKKYAFMTRRITLEDLEQM